MLLNIIKECRIVAYVGIGVAALAASPSLIGRVMAESPHEIDFTQDLIGPTGDPLPHCVKYNDATPRQCIEIAPMTLGDAAIEALQNPLDKDKNEPGSRKFQRDRLSRKVWKNAHASLSVEDIALIKDRIGDGWGAAVVGAAWPLLDPTLADK